MAVEMPTTSAPVDQGGEVPSADAAKSHAGKATTGAAKNVALKAASGQDMEAELQAGDSSAPKIDSDKLVSDIGATDSVNGTDSIKSSQKKMGDDAVEISGQSTGGEVLQWTGMGVGIVGACITPVFPPVGLIVVGVGALMGLGGSQMKKSAQKTAEIEKGTQDKRMAQLDEQMGGENRPNIINEQISGADTAKSGEEAPGSAASAMLEHSSGGPTETV